MKCVPSPQALRLMQHMIRGPVIRPRACHPFLPLARQFHASAQRDRAEKHVLSDIGEGVKEVQIIQWFVEEGASIEEWSPLCEVQSDKASVEITSKYTGVVKKIYFGQDDVVQTGDTLLEVEVEGDAESEQSAAQESEQTEQVVEAPAAEKKDTAPEPSAEPEQKQPGKHGSLATPAVRGLLKEHDLAIEDIVGTGKDGRVLKEDVYKHLEGASQQSTPTSTSTVSKPQIDAKQTETVQKLTPVQSAMFKSMTGSLSIPHFLFSDSVDLTTLSSMRSRLNSLRNPDTTPKLSYMPFMIKAVSLALNHYPLLNARLDVTTDPKKPQLVLRSVHNIGVAMDTPNGLIVPVIKAVNARSITSIAEELQRLAKLGQAGKLSNNDLIGGTITVSNIGNVGGEVVAPVIVEGQLAIMGVGKIKTVPVFAEDGVTVKPALQANVSWSADHRVVDGATMARVATKVQKYLEEPGMMIADMS